MSFLWKKVGDRMKCWVCEKPLSVHRLTKTVIKRHAKRNNLTEKQAAKIKYEHHIYWHRNLCSYQCKKLWEKDPAFQNVEVIE